MNQVMVNEITLEENDDFFFNDSRYLVLSFVSDGLCYLLKA